MSLSRVIYGCLLALVFSVPLKAQKPETHFPTNDEIKLVMTQTARAIGQYKPFLDMEEKMLGKENAEAVAKDRRLVKSIETAVTTFEKEPQAFNGPLGFVFFEWLDDASRNALLCSNSASNDIALSVISGDKARADSDFELQQGCSNASTLLYTVSENAGALYTRYVEGEEKLAIYGSQVATECTDILKKKTTTPKQ
jgi:hypothetical protein